jgi:hypothetical protein
MISWMILLVTAAVIAGVFGLGAVAAAMKIVITVTLLLAIVGWAHRPAAAPATPPLD